MIPADLLGFVRRRPFQPFRIHLSAGTTYDIHHPEMVMVGMASAVIGLPANLAEPLYARTETVSLDHVVRLVPIEQVKA
jgi:hypothetical protein